MSNLVVSSFVSVNEIESDLAELVIQPKFNSLDTDELQKATIDLSELDAAENSELHINPSIETIQNSANDCIQPRATDLRIWINTKYPFDSQIIQLLHLSEAVTEKLCLVIFRINDDARCCMNLPPLDRRDHILESTSLALQNLVSLRGDFESDLKYISDFVSRASVEENFILADRFPPQISALKMLLFITDDIIAYFVRYSILIDCLDSVDYRHLRDTYLPTSNELDNLRLGLQKEFANARARLSYQPMLRADHRGSVSVNPVETSSIGILQVNLTSLRPATEETLNDKKVEGNKPPAGKPNGAGESEVGKQTADAYAELRQYARAELKGQERAVVEALCDANGELPIADLAIKDGVGWEEPKKGFTNAQRRLKEKLSRRGWKLTRHDNAAKLHAMKARKTR